MKPFDPNTFAHELPAQHRQYVQSVSQVLSGNVDMGTPSGNAPDTSGVNAGVYTQFKKGNSTGVLIRIAASGITDSGAPYNWTGIGAGVVINHGLLRKPIGFKLVDCDGAIQIYRTAAPDENQITLAPTDPAVSVTVYVF